MRWLAVIVGALLGTGAAAWVASRSAPREEPEELVKARGFTPGPRGRLVRWIVLHTTEPSPPSADALAPGVARATARYFANGSPDASGKPQNTSAHYVVGSDEAIQCVEDDDVANHALGANPESIGIELTGRASWSAEVWADPRAESMLRRAAAIAARVAFERGIPLVFRSALDLQAGEGGITTHAEVSGAFHRSDHTDPGPNFPMGHFLELVRAAAGAT